MYFALVLEGLENRKWKYLEYRNWICTDLYILRDRMSEKKLGSMPEMVERAKIPFLTHLISR